MGKENVLISRRDFFGSLWTDMKYFAGTAIKTITPERTLIRPPGAIEEIAFLAGCRRCGMCKEVCPEKAIRIAGPQMGNSFGTPYLEPSEVPCSFCLKCVEVCPSEALLIQKDDVSHAIGVASIDPERCLAYNQQLCSSCVYACPTDIKAISLEDFQYPKIDQEKCIGCGQCAKICLAPDSAIKVVPR